jgi:hypothetical protein
MKPCELSEFTLLLKLGLWNGGAVSGLGYVSAATKHADGMPMVGLAGLWLGGGVTLESAEGGQLVLSVYEPYAGRYECFAVSADFNMPGFAERPTTLHEIEMALAAAIEQETKAIRRGRGTTFSEYTSLRDKRRYQAAYTSVRTGSIPTPRRRR